MSTPISARADSGANALHHPIFYRFPKWEGIVPKGFVVDFLGVMQREYFWQPWVDNPPPYPADRYVRTEYPEFTNDYFEWIAVLEAVVAAKDHFTMIELGAGHGRWTAKGGCALRLLGDLPYELVAVEAEPTHFQWMREHFTDNGLDLNHIRMVEAAVTRTDGKVGFHVGKEAMGGTVDCYSQSIGGPQLVDAVSLATVLRPLSKVDIMHVDVQGAELEVLQAGAAELDEKVKRIFIGTHSRKIEEGLQSLFNRLGWTCLCSYPCLSTVDTEFGLISFTDGAQTWVNPSYSSVPAEEVTILKQKLEASRREGARLWNELETVKETGVLPGSVGWKIVDTVKRIRQRVAPGGSRRRKMYDYFTKKI